MQIDDDLFDIVLASAASALAAATDYAVVDDR